jgi:hypothetical protein
VTSGPAAVTMGPQATAAAAAVALGGHFGSDFRQRRSGGYLGRAQPKDVDQAADLALLRMQRSSAGKSWNRTGEPSKGDTNMNIDPALSGDAAMASAHHHEKEGIKPECNGHEGSDAGTVTPTHAADTDIWTQNVLLLERLQSWVQDRLQRGDYADDDGQPEQQQGREGHHESHRRAEVPGGAMVLAGDPSPPTKVAETDVCMDIDMNAGMGGNANDIKHDKYRETLKPIEESLYPQLESA